MAIFFFVFGGLIRLVRRDAFTKGTEADFCRLVSEKCGGKVVKFH